MSGGRGEGFTRYKESGFIKRATISKGTAPRPEDFIADFCKCYQAGGEFQQPRMWVLKILLHVLETTETEIVTDKPAFRILIEGLLKASQSYTGGWFGTDEKKC